MNKFIIFLFIYLVGNSFIASAVPINLPVPRFVTIKFNEVNARTGPENDCPIEWIYLKKDEPVEVIAEYGKWRKIKDVDGEGGWVHSSVIAGKRSIIIIGKNPVPMLENPSNHKNVKANLLPNLRCSLHKCEKDWCLVTCKNHKGWVSRKHIWGIYPEE